MKVIIQNETREIVDLVRRGSDNPTCPVCGHYNAVLPYMVCGDKPNEFMCRDCGTIMQESDPMKDAARAKARRAVEKRQRIEKRIARRVVKDAIAAGFALNVNNGGDGNELQQPSTSARDVVREMFATDEERLIVYVKGEQHDHQWHRHGWVYFVYGNDGFDVICDYTTNLEDFLTGANELASKIESEVC